MVFCLLPELPDLSILLIGQERKLGRLGQPKVSKYRFFFELMANRSSYLLAFVKVSSVGDCLD